MRSACALGLAGWCLFAVAALGDEKTPVVDEYHSPETFLTAGRAVEYLPHARWFLRQNPLDARAPRIAMDILMFATSMQDEAGIKEAKQLLLFQYGTSLPAAYWIKTSEPDDLCKLLKATFTAADKPLDKKRLQTLYLAIAICLRTHGVKLADDELWAQAALAAPDAATAAQFRQQIKQEDNEAARLLSVALDTRLSMLEKFVRLQEIEKSETARAWQRYLFAHELSEADRADAAVRTAVVENLLKDRNFTPALEHLCELTKGSADPKLLFYRGWAEAATAQVPAAISSLNQITEQHPKSAWAAPAQELTAALSTLSANLDEHITAFEELYIDLAQQHPDLVELELQWGATASERTQFWLGLDFAKDGIELLVRKADKPLLGYSSRSDSSQFFVDGDTSIRRFGAKGVTPLLDFNVRPSPTAYLYNFSFNFSSNSGSLRQSTSSLLNSPAFATREARRDWVRYHLKKGVFPAKVVAVNGERSFRWLAPQHREPKLQVIEMRLTAENRLAGVAWGDSVKIHNIRYGASESISLTKAKWPDLPVSEGAEMGSAQFFRFFGTALDLLDVTEKTPAKQ